MITLLVNVAVRQAVLPISVDQYHRLGQAGIVSERTKLLRGVVVGKMTKSPLHTSMVAVLVDWLQSEIPADCYVRKEEPLTLADSEPEPEVAVVAGSREAYRSRHPAAAHLVIEVAVATRDIDRAKADIYAAAGVSEYWIVLPEEGAVEVYTDATATDLKRSDAMQAKNRIFV